MIRHRKIEETYGVEQPPLCRFGQGEESWDYDPDPVGLADMLWTATLVLVAFGCVTLAAYVLAILIARGMR